MKIAEIKELTIKELETRKREMRQEIFNLRIQQQAGQLEKPHMLRSLRRDAARVDTVLTEKRKTQQSAATPAPSPAQLRSCSRDLLFRLHWRRPRHPTSRQR